MGTDVRGGLQLSLWQPSVPGRTSRTHPCNISLHLPLAVGEEAVGRHCALHSSDDGDVRGKHDHNRDEEAEDEDGDDVGLVDGGVVGFGPVHLARAVTSI